MTRSTIQFFAFAAIVVGVIIRCETSSAWSATGHHVAAVVAYEAMQPAEQAAVMDVLSHHPQFDKYFQPPAGVTDAGAMIDGVSASPVAGLTSSGEVTTTARRGTTSLGRPSLLAMRPHRLSRDHCPPTRHLKHKTLIGQATELCVRILADKTQSTADRAIALCWVLHLFADGHQPCHAGSLYAPIFPDGDRGGNSIRFSGRGNLHSAWDNLLGGSASASDVRRRVMELKSVDVGSDRPVGWLRPEAWLAESRSLGRSHLYTDGNHRTGHCGVPWAD